jgi:hypothetical protein
MMIIMKLHIVIAIHGAGAYKFRVTVCMLETHMYICAHSTRLDLLISKWLIGLT